MGALRAAREPLLTPEQREDAKFCLAVIGVIVAVVLLFAGICWYADQSTRRPVYTVAITGASGLAPATDAQRDRGVVSPAFNLTVGVASRSALRGGCVDPGTSLTVSYSYLRLPLASGPAPDVCVGPRESSRPRPAVARGTDVAMPGFLAASLAEEMSRGEAAFEVKLTSLEMEEKRWKVLTCWVRAGYDGAGAGAASKPCIESFIDIEEKKPEPKPADSGYDPYYPVPTGGRPAPYPYSPRPRPRPRRKTST